MRAGGIGRLIGKLRAEAGIAQSKLCKGLCSLQLLSKIEREERVPDMLLLEALLQRLGKSPEKLEIILSVEEYRHIEHRDEIEDAIRFGRLDEGENKLQSYLAKYGHEGNMQKMYGYRMQGVIELEREEYDRAEEWMKRAVSFSAQESKWLKLEKEFLSTFEIENFVLLSQIWLKMGKLYEAKEMLEHLHQYVVEHITDKEEMIKIQSKIVSLLGDIYNRIGWYVECVTICEPILELERDEFMIQAMSLIMNNLICAYSHMGEREKAERVGLWKEHLEAVFECQGLSISIVNGMYFNTCTRQYFLDSELIRGERIRKGMTQEKLSEGIYECVESLSRVETGKECPNRIKFQQLMERLGMDKLRYNGYLATTEYKAMEIDGRIEKLLARRCFEEAERELEYLERLIDMTEVQNIQLLHRRRNALLEKAAEITPLQTMEEAKELLSLTYGFEEGQFTRVPFRNELYLYNQICMMLWKLGRREECIIAYRKMIECFERSSVNSKYLFRSLVLVIFHISDRLEKMGELEEAQKWTENLLKDVLKNGKCSAVELLLSNLVCIFQAKKKDRELCLKMARHTLWCSELFKQERFFDISMQYIYDNFGIREERI